MTKEARLTIRNFAQIAQADIAFGDLTVLVGAQGTGKSLVLQWLKTAVDGRQILSALRDAGQSVRQQKATIDLIFGVGMGAAWRAASAVAFNGTEVSPGTIGSLGNGTERVFYIPAHRSMLISDGWAAPFQKLSTDTPVVARIFSQSLFDRFSERDGGALFPVERLLKREYCDLINSAIFHGGTVGIEQDRQYAKRLKLTHGKSALPFMTWTAGQREFTPLLLGLYHVLPSRQIRKQPHIDWVVVEEPEMGLHPQAITVFLLLVLELLSRDYRVVLSTHSPHLLTGVWMLKRLQEYGARWQLVCQAFGIQDPQGMAAVAKAALQKDYRVYLMDYESNDKVYSHDISDLDPDAEDDRMSGWGGLTGYSSQFSDAVRAAVNECGEDQDDE